MILTRTPFRVSLFGGGTDYPPWYKNHGGAVMGMAINKYCYISVRYLPPFFEHKHRIVYSRVESVREVEEIKHPAVRAILHEHSWGERGLEIHHDGDLPARSGLGSSSSFTVGLLNALGALRGQYWGKRQLADEAIRIEQSVIKENVGCQDQIWAAYGGFNRIDIARDGSYAITPVIFPTERKAELLGSLMMFFTGITRLATDIAGKQLVNLDKNEQYLHSLRAMVDTSCTILQDSARPLDELGRMLHESWMRKREMAEGVSNSTIDEIYQEGLAVGALGGKVLGAGGGGFVLFYVPPGRREAVRERLRGLIEVQFGIDAGGSTVVVYEPGGFGN